jgi:hypothetical protein
LGRSRKKYACAVDKSGGYGSCAPTKGGSENVKEWSEVMLAAALTNAMRLMMLIFWNTFHVIPWRLPPPLECCGVASVPGRGMHAPPQEQTT